MKKESIEFEVFVKFSHGFIESTVVGLALTPSNCRTEKGIDVLRSQQSVVRRVDFSTFGKFSANQPPANGMGQQVGIVNEAVDKFRKFLRLEGGASYPPLLRL